MWLASLGHEVTLFDLAKKNIEFITSAKVESKEVTESGRDQIEVRLIQFQLDQWLALKNIFSARQDEILKFFSAATR